MIRSTAAAILVLIACQATANAAPRDSVVKIEVTARMPDLARPWSRKSPSRSSGSGVVIESGRILTNAHVVRYASQIEVQPSSSSEKHVATVVAIAPKIDLAVLELEDPSVAQSLPPLEMDETIPELRQQVSVLGYPVGGSELSVTEGVVSRIEFAGYYFGEKALRIQIDAALNPGNSGGPAVSDGRMIGLVFSKIREAENVGYLIPVEEVLAFLADIEDGQYDGKPVIIPLGRAHRLENAALRKRLKLKGEWTGVVTTSIGLGNEQHPLKVGDVITRIGPHAIDNQGYVRVRDDLRLGFGYYVSKLAADGSVPLSIVRDGEPMQIQSPVTAENPRLIQPLNNTYPDYFIWGPIVFTPACQELIFGNGGKVLPALSATQSPLLARVNDIRRTPGEQAVIIPNRLFPHRVSRGYDSVVLSVVESINGEPVTSLARLVEILRDCQDGFVEFKLGGVYPSLVFEREEAEAATEEILADEGIRRRGSPALLKVWNAAPAGEPDASAAGEEVEDVAQR
ncbi:MAG: trypsin-like peptidase domain-containing protein [Planctomycetota bacterium]